jgi:hypothetical protein
MGTKTKKTTEKHISNVTEIKVGDIINDANNIHQVPIIKIYVENIHLEPETWVDYE